MSGEFKQYYENGQVVKYFNYKDGALFGLFSGWREDGTKIYDGYIDTTKKINKLQYLFNNKSGEGIIATSAIPLMDSLCNIFNLSSEELKSKISKDYLFSTASTPSSNGDKTEYEIYKPLICFVNPITAGVSFSYDDVTFLWKNNELQLVQIVNISNSKEEYATLVEYIKIKLGKLGYSVIPDDLNKELQVWKNPSRLFDTVLFKNIKPDPGEKIGVTNVTFVRK
jgi:hypothetical protein